MTLSLLPAVGNCCTWYAGVMLHKFCTAALTYSFCEALQQCREPDTHRVLPSAATCVHSRGKVLCTLMVPCVTMGWYSLVLHFCAADPMTLHLTMRPSPAGMDNLARATCSAVLSQIACQGQAAAASFFYWSCSVCCLSPSWVLQPLAKDSFSVSCTLSIILRMPSGT